MSDKRPSNARPYGADARPSVGGGALDAPPSPAPSVIANQCALPPLQGEVSLALVPVTEGFCASPVPAGAIAESPAGSGKRPTNGLSRAPAPTVQTTVPRRGDLRSPAGSPVLRLSLRTNAPCLPLRGPWVCPSAHTGAVGVPLTEGVSPSSVGATLAVARQAAPMSDKRSSNARPYGADARPSVGAGALDGPPTCAHVRQRAGTYPKGHLAPPLRSKPTFPHVTRHGFQSVAAGDTTIIHSSFFILPFSPVPYSSLFPRSMTVSKAAARFSRASAASFVQKRNRSKAWRFPGNTSTLAGTPAARRRWT